MTGGKTWQKKQRLKKSSRLKKRLKILKDLNEIMKTRLSQEKQK